MNTDEAEFGSRVRSRVHGIRYLKTRLLRYVEGWLETRLLGLAAAEGSAVLGAWGKVLRINNKYIISPPGLHHCHARQPRSYR